MKYIQLRGSQVFCAHSLALNWRYGIGAMVGSRSEDSESADDTEWADPTQPDKATNERFSRKLGYQFYRDQDQDGGDFYAAIKRLHPRSGGTSAISG